MKIEEIDLEECLEDAKFEKDLPFEKAYCILSYLLKLENDYQNLVTKVDSLEGIIEGYKGDY